MNRIIKFRGKRIDNGKWVYGYMMWDDIIFTIADGEIEVDPATVGQFTEHEIAEYEDDVIETAFDKGVVKYIPHYGSFMIHYIHTGFLDDLTKSKRKIGNIHDNPELI